MRKTVMTALAVSVLLATVLVPGWARADAPTGKLLLVLDSSGSMAEPAGDGHSKIANAKSALHSVVDSLDPQAQVGMRVYGATVFDQSKPGACEDSQLVVPIGPAGDKKKLSAAIDKYKPYGETPIAYALRQAGQDLGSSGQRTIVLVSDGEETCHEDPCEVAKDLSQKGIDLRIDVIGLDVSGQARQQLECVAKNGKGKYTQADSLDALKKQLDTAKERALHPFEVSGTPVKGTSDQVSAPDLTTGRWTDRLPSRGKTTYYRLHRGLGDGSTFWVGVSAELKVAGALTNGVDVKITTEGGDACGSSYPYAIGGSDATTGLMFGLAVSRGDMARPECTSGDLILTLNQRGNNQTDLGGTAVQLDVYEEPPVADVDALPAKADEPTWTPMALGSSTKIKGGTTFANAPALTSDRTYRFDIAPGETQIFTVDADWGQRIQAYLAAGSMKSQPVMNTAKLDLIGPYGGDAHTSWAKDMPAGVTLVPSTGAKAASMTPEIRYRNTESSPGYSHAAAALPGTFYVVLSYPKRKGVTMPTIPVTMKTSVLGTAGAGAPTYLEKASSAAPSASPSASVATGDPSSSSAGQTADATPAPETPRDGSTPPWALAGGLVAAALVLGGVGVIILRRLRRS